MKLSYYTNVIKLKEDKYLLLKPFSRPLVVDKEAVRAINSDDSHSELTDILNKENFITELEKEEEIKRRNILNLQKYYDCKFLLIYGSDPPFRGSIKENIIYQYCMLAEKSIRKNEISEFFFKIRKEKEVNKNE